MNKHSALSPEISETASSAPVLLPLDAPRSVAFKTKTGAFVYSFRRISLEDWQRYFASIVNQTIQTKAGRDQVFETESALLDLVDRALKSVEGYGDLSALDEWKSSLPLRHRLAAGMALRSVVATPRNDEQPIVCAVLEISLDANWGATDDGKTTQYSGLIHRFRQPGIADLKRFNFESARTRLTGTPEMSITSYPSRQAIAMKIYDDLIDSVDGYCVGDLPLSSVEEIRREMDGAHKAAAALALFEQGDEITIE
jgi:hypothetical protein